MNFAVTRENERAVRSYLARLLRDASRLPKALHFLTTPEAAHQAYQNAAGPEALTAWIGKYLSRAGRQRLLVSLRVRRSNRDRANWRIPKSLYDRLKTVAADQGFDTPEDWLDRQLQPYERPKRSTMQG